METVIDIKQLNQRDLELLVTLGDGDPIKGITIALGYSRSKKDNDRTVLAHKDATAFIESWLVHTKNRTDRIIAKELYTEYCESTNNKLSNQQFNKLLASHGFEVVTGNGNKLTVFYIRSIWL